jgi:hypothetical protein
MRQYRQGDVFIIETSEPLPSDATRVERDHGRIVLAYGEVTGHAHAIADDDAALWEIDLDARFLEIVSEVDLVHEEHSTITLPPGNYRVVQQREYSPEEVRRVAD